MSKQGKEILVTCALPYANAPLHLGHMLEQVQADIWVRYQRMIGNNVHFVCADDSHGAPIMIQADRLGISPEELIEQIKQKHISDSSGFFISFDNYHSTHSEENKQLVEFFYQQLLENNYIVSKQISQLYDPEKEMFLPDRYVKGICPVCKSPDQYGDNCEVCSAFYSPMELIDAYSVVSGAKPIIKQSEHYFFDLPQFETILKEWLNSGTLQTEVVNKMMEWFEDGLKQWDITRDAPYFGFKIPNSDNKYFYVWVDAPIGYFASLKNLATRDKTINFDSFLDKDTTTEMYHFIGKDIMYFHSLFWPAMLHGVNFRKPTNLFVHGYVTVDGAKMSKSRGTFIKVDTYLKYLPAECLRYYYASKLSSKIDDIDLNLEDFVQKINTDIVNKLVNLASRTAGFINKKFDSLLADQIVDQNLFKQFIDKANEIGSLYEQREYSKVIRIIMNLTDIANRYIDEQAPWVLAKQEGKEQQLQLVSSLGLNLFKVLITYLKPVLPVLAEQVEQFLQTELTWESIAKPLINHRINNFKALFKRIEMQQINALIEDSKKENQQAQQLNNKIDANIEEIAETITIDQFVKMDLRVAEVLHVEEVPESNKLLRFELNLGNEKRQIFSGIKSAYKPEDLIGKMVIVIANLAPRKMRFGVSEGMILSASDKEGSEIYLLEPHSGAKAGMKIS